MMAHRLQPSTRIDIIDPSLFKIAYLKPFKTEDLPRTGLKIAKVVHGQLTVECRTSAAHAFISGIAN